MVERRLMEYHFFDGSSEGVKHAVLAYQNVDGGFGHGLEPDSSSPESQPLFTLMALELLDEANALDQNLIDSVLGFLASITNSDGGLPWMFKPAGEYPRADHFEDVSSNSTINPTAPILGILIKHGVKCSWMDAAEKFCMVAIEKSQQMNTGFGCHCMNRRMAFLERCSDKEWAARQINRVTKELESGNHVCRDLGNPHLGLFGTQSPINFAPAPNSTLHSAFSSDELDRNLDAFIGLQNEDGSWKTNYGINDFTRTEWDGMFTLWVLKALKAYGRIEGY